MGFVRWTEQRNFEAVLDMLADGRLDVKPLISHRFALERAAEAYALVAGGGPSLGILLQYPSPAEKPDANLLENRVLLGSPGDLPLAGEARRAQRRAQLQRAGLGEWRGEPAPYGGRGVAGNGTGQVTVAFVGAGNYATGVLIPAFKTAGARLKTVASSGGVSGVHAGRKHGFEQTTTAAEAVFADAEIDAVVIVTRHDSHARLVCEALRAGKHVFVEKPLALTMGQLAEIQTVYETTVGRGFTAPDAGVVGAVNPRPTVLMVGFNRRFAPQVKRIKALLEGAKGPKAFVMTVNAGAIPPGHWTQDVETGGGRIVGEACHFIDLLRFLAAAPIVSAKVSVLGGSAGDAAPADKVSFTLSFADGSLGTVHYLANGHKSFAKERLEVFCAGRILQLDNFRKLRGYGWPGFSRMNLWRQDKGQKACAAAFIDAIRTGAPSPIPFDEIVEVARVSVEVAGAAR